MGFPVTGRAQPPARNDAVVKTQASGDSGVPPEVAERWQAQDTVFLELARRNKTGEADALYQRAIGDVVAKADANPAYVARVHALLARAIPNALRQQLAAVEGKARYRPEGHAALIPGIVEISVPRTPEGDAAYEAAIEALGKGPYGWAIDAFDRRDATPEI